MKQNIFLIIFPNNISNLLNYLPQNLSTIIYEAMLSKAYVAKKTTCVIVALKDKRERFAPFSGKVQPNK